MIELLKKSNRFNITLLLGVMSLFCFFLSAFRFYFWGTTMFLFLNWNLFLAFIPWIISTVISTNKFFCTTKYSLPLLLVAWLLFFPNAPYILTDIFHLRPRGSVPIWFDLVVLLSFAWTGLVYGFISLVDIEILLLNYLKRPVVIIISIALLFLGSFGIYVGRYLRWNSWDIVSDPSLLLSEIGNRFINPFSHPRTWGMTIFLGVLLNMMFWTFKFFTANNKATVYANP